MPGKYPISGSRTGPGTGQRLDGDYFLSDVLEVAPSLIGKVLVRKFPDGRRISGRIIETEAYRGREDLACHASKSRSARTEIMYRSGGHIYMYLIYGMYWMLNFVTAGKEEPQAVLVRGLDIVQGPGRLTRQLELDGGFYGENLADSRRLWIEDHGWNPAIQTAPRIGVDYAGEYWASRPWRFTARDFLSHA
jgi:DNA-3-methyladenine glycosylase